ncbi:MAG: AIR synthase family protein [Chloroflexi bacterium]|nr:AIR synthase family protein [Chloroflexota bacterium]
MSDFLPVGKLDMDCLAELLDRYTSTNGRVLVGPKVGGDATVIDFGSTALIAKTDPITFAIDEIGWYAVNVNANDIASVGGVPKWFLSVLLLPGDHTTIQMVEDIFAQISSACASLGIAFCGGHTEITHDLDRPIVVGQMLGETSRNGFVTAAGAQVGDDIILTKGIAIEATSIIAREHREELRSRYPAEFVDRARNFLRDPGISVFKDARIAVETAPVHAMHDPTEGGLATGLHEVAVASNVGMLIDQESIPIFPESARLCADFGLAPLGVIASGALIIIVPAGESAKLIEALDSGGIRAAVIGRVTTREEGVKMITPAGTIPLPRFDRDQIAKIF